MNFDNLYERVLGRYRGTVSRAFFRRRVPMRNRTPIVSFTFDDFPSSALQVAGAILLAHGARGTYYASLGLMGQESPVGRLFTHADLLQAVADGHELGCHSYAHCDAWKTPPRVFERSVIENREALGSLISGASFLTLAYPIKCPRPHTKRLVAKYFSCCRGYSQGHHVNSVSPTHVGAYFIELAHGNVDAIKRLIDANARDNGWLVFATHDVRDTSSRYGCTPAVFEAVVRHAVASGARLLPVAEAWHEVTVGGKPITQVGH